MLILFFSTWITYRALTRSRAAKKTDARKNWLQKTVFLLSIDGFRYDYLQQFAQQTTNIQLLAKNGARAERLIPSYPTKTFPNHYTLVTGKYPANHGILNNGMYNKVNRSSFTMSSTETEWWQGGEPIWITVEKQKHSASTIFWPGSNVELQGMKPTRYQEIYDDNFGDKNKIDLLMKYFDEDDKKLKERVQANKDNEDDERLNLLYVSYFSGVDHEGHSYGPLSQATRDAVNSVDQVVGYLFSELKKRDVNPLTDVHIVIVSDHGMSQLNKNCEVNIGDIVGPTDLSQFKPFYGPFVQLTAIDRSGDVQLLVDRVYDKLKQGEEVVQGGNKYTTYKANEVPDRLHFKQACQNFPETCSDLVIAVENHCWMSTYFVQSLNGDHGYDNKVDDMGALFVASGPRIQQFDQPVAPFENIHLYPLLAEIMDLDDESLPSIDGSLDAVEHLIREADEEQVK